MTDEKSNASCEVQPVDWSALEGTFEEVAERFGTDVMWVRFFGVRPCCPAPGANAAQGHVDELKRKIATLDQLAEDQRAELSHIADERLEWYLKTFAANRP